MQIYCVLIVVFVGAVFDRPWDDVGIVPYWAEALCAAKISNSLTHSIEIDIINIHG